MQPLVSASSWVQWWVATSLSMMEAFIPPPLPAQQSSLLMQVGLKWEEISAFIHPVFEVYF